MCVDAALFERLLALRRRYTGESEAVARPALLAGFRFLNQYDVGPLLAAMADGVPLPRRLRALVLPDAVLPRQQELESVVFEALGQATNLDHSEDDLIDNLRMVRPHSEYLVLYLPTESVGMLVRKLLPSANDNGRTGYPGLRARSFGRHVELYFADRTPGVAVHVAEVHWGLRRETSAGCRWPSNDTEPLRPDEARAMEVRRMSPGAARLGSALLRRLGVFSRLPLGIMGHDVCYVDWREEPSRTELAELLTNPVAGIAAAWYRRTEDHVVVDTGRGRIVLHGPGHTCGAQPAPTAR